MNIVKLLKPKCNVAYIKESNTIRQGIEKMKFHGYTAIPVINDMGSYVGTVSEGDFLWDMLDNDLHTIEEEEERTVKDILKINKYKSIKINTPVDELLILVMDQNFVVVTDDRGVFMGIITRRDIIKFFYDKNQEEKL